MVRHRRGAVALSLAALLGVVVVPLTLMLDSSARGRELDRREALVKYGAVYLIATAHVEGNQVDLSAFQAVQARPGQPSSMFVDPKGRWIDGDVPLTLAFRKAAVRQVHRVGNRPRRIGPYLVVVEGIGREDDTSKLLVAAVSFLDVASLDRASRNASLQRWALALGAWLILTAAGSLLLLRLVRRPLTEAAAERSFFADAAHELKTPWALVRARVDLARDGGPELDGHLAAISTTASEAAHTVDDMLLLARLDAGSDLERERLRGDALVATCVSDAEAAHIGIPFVADALEQVSVMGDEALLSHAIRNLLDNAARHGGPPIDVTLTREGDRAVIRVRDRGRGVPPSQRDDIFGRFNRGSSRAGGGNGLGLSITRAVAEAHGGTIELEAPPHGEAGSCFVLTLPAL